MVLRGRADLHMHTTASDGWPSPQQLVDYARATRLNLIAVTDHDTIEGAVRAAEYAAASSSRLQVVIGEEVSSRDGHIVGLFVERRIRPGMSAAATVDAIHDQGGLVIVPHPFMPGYFGSIQPNMLRRLLERHHVDGIEMVSTVPIGARRRKLLEELAKVGRVASKALDGQPYESLLVLDAVLGLSNLVQARVFNKAIPITGLALAKLDSSARGGAVIAIESELDVPVKLAGVGEGIDDLTPFDPSAFVHAIFD